MCGGGFIFGRILVKLAAILRNNQVKRGRLIQEAISNAILL
jgi:hypothetical protein